MALAEPADDSQSLVARASGWPARSRTYIEELQLEMKRVSWPSWKQVRATTAIVVVAVFAFAAYFALVDMVVNSAITKLMNGLTR